MRYMNRVELLSWLNWHATNKSLAYVEKDGKVLAAGVARQVTPLILELMKDETAVVRQLAHYMNDDGGEIIYAEQAASVSKDAFAGILLAMKGRFPKANKFMFQNKKRASMRKIYDTNRFLDVAIQLGRTA